MIGDIYHCMAGKFREQNLIENTNLASKFFADYIILIFYVWLKQCTVLSLEIFLLRHIFIVNEKVTHSLFWEWWHYNLQCMDK